MRRVKKRCDYIMSAKTLVVAEKPSVGRDIAKVLGASKKGDGFLYSEEYIVSWAIGHLVTLFDPEDYDPVLKGWKINTLPIIPQEIKLKGVKSTKSQLIILKKLMNDKDVSEIVCATDSGREGELIFRYIYSIIKCKKKVKRLWISSMTDTAIKNGFANLRDSQEYDNLYQSAKCRSEADWLVGINATRAYTIRYKALLSIGRVQTPTLAIITERQKEIDMFVSKDYWTVKAVFEKDAECRYTGIWIDKNEETSIFEREKAEMVVEKVTGKTGEIKSVTSEEKKQPPQLLYDLTELQRDANKKYGFSAKKTLGIAQDLYEKRKMITYPRTDSRYLPGDMTSKLNNIISKLNVEPYAEYVSYIQSLPSLPITKRIIDDSKISDHHAIIPTEANVNLSPLSADEKKIYDLVTRKFLQAFYPYYIYSITKIITVSCDEYFLTKGTTVIQKGFMELYKDDKKEGDNEPVLPVVKQGDVLEVKEVDLEQKKTKPPKAYTEASLLSAMENAGRFVEDESIKEQMKESGIGTPATRAAIIERIIEVGYIERKGKTLAPTQKAMNLIEIVPRELKSPETTGKWEKGLNLIAKGKMDPARFMESINRYVNYIVKESINTRADVSFPSEKKSGAPKRKQDSLGICPLCGKSEVFENTKAFFCGGWREGCKFTIWKNALEANGIVITSEIIKKLISDKAIKGIEMSIAATHEKAVADLYINETTQGYLELKNVARQNSHAAGEE